MGAAKFYAMRKDFNKAIEHLTAVTVRYKWFLPGFAQKAQVLMEAGDWDAAVDTAHKVLEQDPYETLSMCITIMHNLTQEARPTLAANKLSELIDALDRFEPKNPHLCVRATAAYPCLCAGTIAKPLTPLCLPVCRLSTATTPCHAPLRALRVATQQS